MENIGNARNVKIHALMRQPGDAVVVTNEELFSDVVNVFAVTQLSKKLYSDMSGWGVGETLLIWLSLWIVWQYSIWTTNWFDPQKTQMRLCLILLMSLSLVSSASIPRAFTDFGGVFGGCHAASQVGRSAFICTQLKLKHDTESNHRRTLGWLCLGASLWIAGACTGHNLRFGLWAGATACEYLGPITGFYMPFIGWSSMNTQWKVEARYITQRSQSFVIVSLGLSLVNAGSALSEAVEWNSYLVGSFFSSLLATLALWWLYFGTFSDAVVARIMHTENQVRAAMLFHYSHAIIVLGIIFNAVGGFSSGKEASLRATAVEMAISSCGPIIYLIGSAFYKIIVYRTVPISHVFGVVMAGAIMPAGFFVNQLAQSWLCTGVLFTVCTWEHYFPQRDSTGPRAGKTRASKGDDDELTCVEEQEKELGEV